MKIDFKKCLPDVLCILLFVVISFAYFYPADIDGRVLSGHDHSASDGLQVELTQYRDTHDGATPRWLRSIFGGMPTYQIAPNYDSMKPMSLVDSVYRLWLPGNVYYVFISLLGFYILLRAFNFKQWMSALGAIVWAFSSYFFIIIAAGHIWKVLTLAFIPPTIAGMVMCYRRKYLWGCVVTALFAALQIRSNHVQMTYYFLIPELLMVVAFLIDAIAKKQMAAFLKSTGAVALGAVIAVALNLSILYNTYEYSKSTMRGKSELVKAEKAGDQTESGLERSYITAWSYGIGETWSLLVPNVKGGASVPLSENETAMKKADPQLSNYGIYGAFTQYWGEQPGTSGPVYVGALVFMLFLMGLVVIPNRNPLKWAMYAATMLSILLSWGHNFMPMTDWFIDHVPMYSKFRTVSSILVVAEFTIPLLAMWTLKLFVESVQKVRGAAAITPETSAACKRMHLGLVVATLATVVFCLCFALAPTAGGDCVSTADRNAVAEYVRRGYFDQMMGSSILASISTMRAAMLSADAWRSIFIVLVGAAVMYFYMKKKALSASVMTAILCVVCVLDMWTVNKRYLNDAMFEYAAEWGNRTEKTEADEYILGKSGDKRDYRVLNFTVSTFNDNSTAAFFSSVGGYHAAKLRRYQELIERHIAKEMSNVYTALGQARLDTVAMVEQGAKYPVYDLSGVNCDSLFPVINMLNTRWFILAGGQDGKAKLPVENTAAYGNAWFVDDVKYVDNANQEIDALGSVSPRHTAVVDKSFKDVLGGEANIAQDSSSVITLTEYDSDLAKYTVESKNGGLAVFSEVYYPGWTATIDGQPAEIGRADYVLRAMRIPAGKHEVVMTFDPQSIRTTEATAYSAYAVLLLLVAAAGFSSWRRGKKSQAAEVEAQPAEA